MSKHFSEKQILSALRSQSSQAQPDPTFRDRLANQLSQQLTQVSPAPSSFPWQRLLPLSVWLTVLVLFFAGSYSVYQKKFQPTVSTTDRQFSNNEQAFPAPDTAGGSLQSELARLPEITVEAEVTRVITDPNTACRNTCPSYEYPKDKVILKISKIVKTEEQGAPTLTIGQEVEVALDYSARPSKIAYSTPQPQPTNNDPEGTVSFMADSAKPAKEENGQFTYTVTTTEASPDKVLPGLSAGQRIQTSLTFLGDSYTAGLYSLLP